MRLSRLPALAANAARSLFTRAPTTNLAYALGRFATVRRLYSLLRGGCQALTRGKGLEPTERSVFPPPPTAEAVAQVRAHAVYRGVVLPAELVAQLRALAEQRPFIHGRAGPSFRIADISRARLPDGEAAIIGTLRGIADEPSVRAVARDPAILGIVAGVLGYHPRRADVQLLYSIASDHPPELRRAAGQTIDYHFDAHSFNFIYANYYLTPTDARSGAHVMVPGSHRRKPLAWLFDSARQTDADIRRVYGEQSEMIIAGAAGCGFIQDSSCYHKALAPVEHDRLMLQVRYF